MDPEETSIGLPGQLIVIPPAFRIPQDVWLDIAITLRDLPPLPHINIITPSSGRRCFHNGHHSFRFCFAKSNIRLRHLSSTCHFLHNLLQYLLYRTVVFDGSQPQRTGSLIKTLVRRSGFLPHTRTIIISKSSNLNPDDFEALSLLLPRFPRLQHIYIYSSIITPKITQVLANAVDLRGLSLEECSWAADVPPDWSKGRFGGHLTDLSLHVGSAFESYYILGPSILPQLFASTIVELSIDDDIIQHGLSSLTRLKTLSVGSASAAGLLKLLALLPSVEKLRIDTFYDSKNPQDFANLLPCLRSLTGSFVLARHFAGRKEIEALHIEAINRSGQRHDLYRPEPYFFPFPSLRTLLIEEVQCNEGTLCLLALRYPLLTHLVIYSHNSPSAMQFRRDLVPWIGGFLQLRVLRLAWLKYFNPALQLDEDGPPSDDGMVDQHEILVEIRHRYCPFLREARIASGHSWSYLPINGWTAVRRQFVDEDL